MNDPDTPEIPLEDALTRLRMLPDFSLIIGHVRSERETYIAAQYETTTGEMAMKHSGAIVALDFLLKTLEG